MAAEVDAGDEVGDDFDVGHQVLLVEVPQGGLVAVVYQGVTQRGGAVGEGQDAVPPVVVLVVQVVEVIQGDQGGGFHRPALVAAFVDSEAVMHRHQGGEGPVATAVAVAEVGFHATEGIGQIPQFQRHATLHQGRVDEGLVFRERRGEAFARQLFHRLVQGVVVGQGDVFFKAFQLSGEAIAARRHATIVCREAKDARP